MKKEPVRTCAACRTPRPKRELIRVVRSPEGEISFDPTGKKSGRGAYICRDAACLERAVKSRALARALQSEISDEVLSSLRGEITRLDDGE